MNAKETDMRKEYDLSQAKRGPVVPAAPNKTRITIRIDSDILNWFRDKVNTRGGGSYQALINEALRAHIENEERGLETVLRRVVREELHIAYTAKKGEEESEPPR